MFGGELFTEDMEEEFGKSLYMPHRELTLQCDLEIEDGGKEDPEDEEEKEEDDAMMVARWRRRLGTYFENVNTHSHH